MIRTARMTRATTWAIVLGAMALAFALSAHSSARDDSEVSAVPLDPIDSSRERIGALVYRGGIHIPRMGQNIGGLSGLRWDEGSGRLLAITDDARWVWMTPVENKTRLTGIAKFEVGDLWDLDGQKLVGKQASDSESLTRGFRGGWLVGFERDHRILNYGNIDGRRPLGFGLDLNDLFGPLEANSGVEALASNRRSLVACVERPVTSEAANCKRIGIDGTVSDLNAVPPKAIADLGGVPTDADMLNEGTAFVLFRSYSPAKGNSTAIVAYGSDGTRTELMTLRPPMTVDNFEGLAVRRQGARVYIYIVSDDNFSSDQRTLLMKFEWMPG